MKNKKQWISILVVAMSLATAWAIRGQFGHEQGAAWAGAIGGLAVVLVSNRKDWYNKMILVALASAVGWGAGGMISYGRVVGFGRADNFVNAFYGLGMLFVIGALFGLLGGGLVGLTLDSTKGNRVKWGSLIAQMTAGGIISYFFLIAQIGIKMTPPRSEAWAVCLGAGLAMLWYMAREKRNSAIRVAIFAALGGGFGFAFGNFLQIFGNVLEINFNMWNVMEYSIGFFGGTGMAYGVFSSKWVQEETVPKKWENSIALFLVVVFIPLIIFRETLAFEHLFRNFKDLQNPENIAKFSAAFSAILMLAMAVILCWKLNKSIFKKSDVMLFFPILLSVYIVLSYTLKGLFAGVTHFNHHLYLLNLLVIFVLSRKERPAIFESLTDKVDSGKWIIYLIAIIFVIAVLTFVSINIHGELGGAHNRFSIN